MLPKKMGIATYFKEYVKSKFNRLADWVTEHAPPVPKMLTMHEIS